VNRFAILLFVLLSAGARAAESPAICRGSNGFIASDLHARTFLWRPEWLQELKAGRDKAPLNATFKAIIGEADASLGQAPLSVVEKTHVPPSGDKHDYYSVAPYYWPNPDTPNHLPYINRDGEVNPERFDHAFDTSSLEKMSHEVTILALAYYLTDDKRYATQAAQLLRAWFITPATKMNPNLRFAQAIPGQVDGRAAGLIDAYRLVRVVESIGLIGKSGALGKADQSALEVWFGAYADWMSVDPIAIAERDATNNHGIYYDAQLMSFALMARKDAMARAVADRFTNTRIATQVYPDGSLPRELKRTRSFHYTNYALAGAFDVAQFAQCFGIDLWNARAPNGRTLRSAFDYVARYAGREKEWPYPELRPNTTELRDLLVRASWGWHSNDYATAAARSGGQPIGSLSSFLRVEPMSDTREQ